MAENVTQRARKLFEDGETREAHRILCEAILDPQLRREARAVLAELFPTPKEAADWMETVFPGLLSHQVPTRQKAAKELTKMASDEYGRRQRERIGHPEAMEAVIKGLGSEDLKVVEATVFAVARVSQFYYRDPRATQPVLKLFDAPKPNIRRVAVRAVTYLTREDAAERILPLLGDKAGAVQAEVARMIMFLAQSSSLTAKMKSRAIEEMLGRFETRDPAAKEIILNAAREIGGAEALEELRRVATSEPDKSLRKSIAETIRQIESRGTANRRDK
jgi:HEAT repeat protein